MPKRLKQSGSRQQYHEATREPSMNTQTKNPTSNILGATGLSKRALAPTNIR